MNRSTLAIMAACLALSACKQGKETGGQAAGTILPGSTSDAMIPLDQVRSEPPLAPAGSGEGTKKGGAKGAATDTASKPDAPSDAAAAPAATPSATPTPESVET